MHSPSQRLYYRRTDEMIRAEGASSAQREEGEEREQKQRGHRAARSLLLRSFTFCSFANNSLCDGEWNKGEFTEDF